MTTFRMDMTTLVSTTIECESREEAEQKAKALSGARDGKMVWAVIRSMGKPIPDDRTLDTVTVDDWRAAGEVERGDFMQRQASAGFASFVCLGCGFPSAYGRSFCEACPPRRAP